MPVPGDVHLLHPLGQRIVEQRGVGRSDEAAEFRQQRGGAGRLFAPRLDRDDAYRKHVALLGAFDAYRAALRIEKGEVENSRRPVGLGPQPALEGVQSLGNDHIARLDAEHRLRVGSVHVVVATLPLLAEMVGLSGHSLGRAPLDHEGFVEPRHLSPLFWSTVSQPPRLYPSIARGELRRRPPKPQQVPSDRARLRTVAREGRSVPKPSRHLRRRAPPDRPRSSSRRVSPRPASEQPR